MESLRLSLIGPGSISFHYSKILRLKEKNFQKEIINIAKILANSNFEIELTPDNGISFEIAKFYRKFKGKKIIGTLPKSDKNYGIKHLTKYIEAEVENKKLFDKIINTKNWGDQNRLKALFGDAVLVLGMSPGSFLEINYALYIYKLILGIKKGIKVKSLNKEIKAGTKIPYTILIYKPFICERFLPKEIEEYATKYKINLVYIKNPKQLKKELENLKEFQK